jgi:hypothetical protein
MARFHGRAFPGAMRTVRQIKRNEAEARNAKTKPHRRRQARRAREAS